MNKSQKLVIETIVLAMLGLPDIDALFTNQLIELVLFSNPSPTIILIFQ